MINKKTNLALSADLIYTKQLIKLVEQTADHIAILKLHIDIISDFNQHFILHLRKMADDYGFLLFEDRKFADIGNIVFNQVKNSIYKITEWADIINAHGLPGKNIIEGLKKGCINKNIGLLLVAEMSTKDNLFNPEYTSSIINIAEQHSDFVIGFIAQKQITNNYKFITMTPGINLFDKKDNLGQRYSLPEDILNKKSHIIIVGRGIYDADNPKDRARLYQQQSWELFKKNHLW